MLSLTDWSYSSAYQSPTEYHDSSAGEFIALASGMAEGVGSSVTSNQQSLELAVFNFQVLEALASGVGDGLTYSNVLSATADSMVNQGTFEYLTSQPAQVNTSRRGHLVIGQNVPRNKTPRTVHHIVRSISHRL